MTQKLLTPVVVGDVGLPNRVIMAPLTRSRAGQPGDVPTDLNAEYYAQRATAGLIVSEGIVISPQGRGYAMTPGLYTDEQEAGWKTVVDAVHVQGGHMAAQLWHVGRVSHALLQENHEQPVAPSSIIASTTKCFPVQPDGTASFVPCSQPRALLTHELPGVVEQYRQATVRARRIGFDFVEIHSANGYLLQQFLSTNTNQRNDQYGGSLENRARLTLEVVDAAIDVIGAGRVGVRLSPHFNANDIDDEQTEAISLYLARELGRRNVAYLHIAEAGAWIGGTPLAPEFRQQLRHNFPGILIFCGDLNAERGEMLLRQGVADAVAFGRPYIANPDLVERIRRGAAWSMPDRATFYGGGAHGYTDYPVLD